MIIIAIFIAWIIFNIGFLVGNTYTIALLAKRAGASADAFKGLYKGDGFMLEIHERLIMAFIKHM